MKAILLVDDKKLGKKHSIVDVADGYARNVLIPKGICSEATNENMNKMKNQVSKEKYEHDVKIAEATQIKTSLESVIKEIKFNPECSKEGKMFGAITTKDIAENLNELGLAVNKNEILLTKPIKELGIYTVKLKLFEGISAEIKVNVVNEK